MDAAEDQSEANTSMVHTQIAGSTGAAPERPPERPPALPVVEAGIPGELRARPQWVVWRYEKRLKKHGTPRYTKAPFDAKTGELASRSDPSTWCGWEQALARYRAGGYDGVGLMFADGGGLVGIDLDDCRDPDTGEIKPWGVALLRLLGGYAEVSPSGAGVKVWVRGRKPEWLGTRCRRQHHDGEVEIYDKARYFAVTGRKLDGAPASSGAPDGIEPACRLVFPSDNSKAKPSGTNGRSASGLCDEQVLERALRASNGGLFSALWRGSTAGHGGDASRADAALCALLRWWCGGDTTQVDRLFRRSGLMRPKWDERRGEKTYGERTLAAVDEGEVREPDGFDGVREKFGGGKHTADSRDSQESSWEQPIELGVAAPAAPFPLDVLPDCLVRFVEESVRALNAPPDYLAVPILALAGGAIGAGRALEVSPGHEQRACIWAAAVGPPGSAKTPALDLCVAPTRAEEERIRQLWQEEMARHRQAVSEYEQDRRRRRRGGEQAEPAEGDSCPVAPPLQRLTVGDATCEALARVLADNPRGVCLVADELVGWALRMDAYRNGKGADRQFWLSAWSGTSTSVDRVKDGKEGPLWVSRPFVGVVGGLAPSRL